MSEVNFLEMELIMADKYCLGDIVELRKEHPCGSRRWEVMRTGADFRIRCTGCSHQVMLPRTRFEKSVKKIIKSNLPASLPADDTKNI